MLQLKMVKPATPCCNTKLLYNELQENVASFIMLMGSMGGIAARWTPPATAISGSIHGLCVTCELCLLLILSLASRVFPWVLWFSSLRKNQHPKFQFNRGRGPQIYQLVAVTCYTRKTKLV
jgi:hypothetical protein